MRIEIRSEGVTHRHDRNYPCVLVQFEPGDSHYHPEKANWMPRNQEIINLIRVLCKINPLFRGKLLQELRRL